MSAANGTHVSSHQMIGPCAVYFSRCLSASASLWAASVACDACATKLRSLPAKWVPHLRGVFVLAAKVGYKYLWSLALPSDFAHDSHSRDRICSSARPCLRQLSERVPEPLAGRRKHRHPALPLHELRTDTQLVGEYPAPKLARPAWPLPHLPRLDRLALSAGRGCARRTLGQNCLDISDKCT